MGNRVIKFNLMGAIGVLILIIAIIVGIVVGINKVNGKKENKTDNKAENKVETRTQENKTSEDKSSENKTAQSNESKDSKSDSNASTDMVEEIEIPSANGQSNKCKVKLYKSDLGYTMKYDFEGFFIDKHNDKKEKYISLYSNTIGITLEKITGKFDEVSAQLEADVEAKKNMNLLSNECSRQTINGNEAIKRLTATAELTDEIYCIKKDEEEYFKIYITSGVNFRDQVMPVIEYMISTFEIIK